MQSFADLICFPCPHPSFLLVAYRNNIIIGEQNFCALSLKGLLQTASTSAVSKHFINITQNYPVVYRPKITPSSKAKQLIKNVKQYKPVIWTRRIVVKWTQSKIRKHAEYCYTGQELDENNIIRKALWTYSVGFQNCLVAMYFREYFVKPSHRRKHFIKICNQAAYG